MSGVEVTVAVGNVVVVVSAAVTEGSVTVAWSSVDRVVAGLAPGPPEAQAARMTAMKSRAQRLVTAFPRIDPED